ncbi:MAG TPA: methylated-DNA--[protein]-cysteine S-methyltransferase [Anaeromyxobacteraceae bacterium]
MTALVQVKSPIGALAVEATDEGVCAVTFGKAGPPRPPISAAAQAHVAAARAALAEYFAGRPPRVPPLVLRGTDFELAVWRALLAIPFGETRTYGELAATLRRPGAARAVGQANHRNPVAILVPCHRVVQAGGGLGGYGGGLEVKRWLLAHEAAHGPILRPG